MTAKSDSGLTPKLSLLERLINDRVAETKGVTHQHIIKLGEGLMTKTYVDVDLMTNDAVKEALASAERRHGRELRAALKMRDGEHQEKLQRALVKQQKYYEGLAGRVAEQREKAEEDRIKVIVRQKDAERQLALEHLQEECDERRIRDVSEAAAKATTDARQGFGYEKEKAVAEALGRARAGYKKREQETVERTRRECEEKTQERLKEQQQKHLQQLKAYVNRVKQLEKALREKEELCKNIEEDFQELQNDYKRFMDYTGGGAFHSDYLLKTRSHTPNI